MDNVSTKTQWDIVLLQRFLNLIVTQKEAGNCINGQMSPGAWQFVCDRLTEMSPGRRFNPGQLSRKLTALKNDFDLWMRLKKRKGFLIRPSDRVNCNDDKWWERAERKIPGVKKFRNKPFQCEEEVCRIFDVPSEGEDLQQLGAYDMSLAQYEPGNDASCGMVPEPSASRRKGRKKRTSEAGPSMTLQGRSKKSSSGQHMTFPSAEGNVAGLRNLLDQLVKDGMNPRSEAFDFISSVIDSDLVRANLTLSHRNAEDRIAWVEGYWRRCGGGV